MIPRTLFLYALIGVSAGAQVLWKEPPPAGTSDWTWGPGGQEMAPRPPFEFVKERFGGTNPKVEVRDSAGRLWTVKFGSEVHADTFAPRVLNALGYAAEPTFYVGSGSISGVHDLKRAKYFVSKDGSFTKARFKLRDPRAKKDVENRPWSWVNNPFVGTHELGGLKVLMMLMSNWDSKDARDGEGSNNEIIVPLGSSSPWYAVTDWGASLGKSGGFLGRNRWDWNGYRVQTPRFVRMKPDGNVDWGFKGKHNDDITKGVGVAEVRWLLPYLSWISDADLETGLTASGASAPVAHEYTRLLRDRIVQLQGIAQSQKVQQAKQ